MDLPANDAELVPEKIEDGKEEGPSFKCDLSDTEIVHKIAQAFLPGLASACVDNTSGGIFKSPASVAVDMRKELVDYLTHRSESFIAEFVILEAGPGQKYLTIPTILFLILLMILLVLRGTCSARFQEGY
jgi:homogentisate solanesyltransferase